MVERTPAEAFPPGEYLRDELEARNWTQQEFAEIIGRPTRLVNEIIAGKRGITPSTAKEIAAALGTSATFWMNLDAAYQLFRAAPAPERIGNEARLREKFPVREIVRRGWIERSQNPAVLGKRIMSFYEISDLDETPELAHAAKRTEYSDERNPLQEAWLYRVRHMAKGLNVPEYSEQKFRAALKELRTFTAAVDEVRHVPRLLAECGVRYVIVEPLPGSKIDGVCMWLDDARPVIGMSLRFDRIDNFWFVLRHEIEHVLRRDGRDVPVVDANMENTVDEGAPPEEVHANSAAAEFCVPQEKLQDFINRVDPIYSRERLIGFARLLDVHPGIVAGQLRRKLDRFDLFTTQLVKVRHLITPAALTDGYGHSVPT